MLRGTMIEEQRGRAFPLAAADNHSCRNKLGRHVQRLGYCWAHRAAVPDLNRRNVKTPQGQRQDIDFLSNSIGVRWS